MSTIKDNKYIWIAFWMWLSFLTPAKAASGEIDVQDIVFSHIQDAYTWHITEWNGQEIAIPLSAVLRPLPVPWHSSPAGRAAAGASRALSAQPLYPDTLTGSSRDLGI